MNLSDLLTRFESAILDDWMREQLTAATRRADLISEAELRGQSRDFLAALREANPSPDRIDLNAPSWAGVREVINRISATRAAQGFTASETATFFLSLKQPIFSRFQIELGDNPAAFAAAIWSTTLVLDQIGLLATEVYQRSRDQIIERQQQELLELSTPVVRLAEGILALPLIGTLDSARTQIVMENLLEQIVRTDSSIAIIDITGVPTVDTLVAQHLLKTVAAARLMGADCIISGIRPQIAQTIVHLGVRLEDVTTKATLADAFVLALSRSGLRIVRDGRDSASGRA